MRVAYKCESCGLETLIPAKYAGTVVACVKCRHPNQASSDLVDDEEVASSDQPTAQEPAPQSGTKVTPALTLFIRDGTGNRRETSYGWDKAKEGVRIGSANYCEVMIEDGTIIQAMHAALKVEGPHHQLYVRAIDGYVMVDGEKLESGSKGLGKETELRFGSFSHGESRIRIDVLAPHVTLPTRPEPPVPLSQAGPRGAPPKKEVEPPKPAQNNSVPLPAATAYAATGSASGPYVAFRAVAKVSSSIFVLAAALALLCFLAFWSVHDSLDSKSYDSKHNYADWPWAMADAKLANLKDWEKLDVHEALHMDDAEGGSRHTDELSRVLSKLVSSSSLSKESKENARRCMSELQMWTQRRFYLRTLIWLLKTAGVLLLIAVISSALAKASRPPGVRPTFFG